MLSFPPAVRIWLALTPADLRKGFDALAELVRQHLRDDPLSGHVFVFRNRRGDRIKLLYWDSDGFVIVYKKLETEDSRIIDFTEPGLPPHNQQAGLAESGRMVGDPRLPGPRRSVMRRQGPLSVPPRLLRRRGRFPSRNSGRG